MSSLNNKIRMLQTSIQNCFKRGKQAEHDKFWNDYQQNGNRTDYMYGFSGNFWTINNFKPKYDIKPTQMVYMFREFNNLAETQIDLVAFAEENGIEFDFTNITGQLGYAFATGGISRIGIINLSNITNLAYSFYGAYNQKHGLQTIDKIISSETTPFLSHTFGYTKWLENVIFEGVIGQNGLDLHWSTKLSKASITSIINTLSTTTSGLSITLSVTAVNNAFETSTGSANGSSSQEWLDLIATKSNWTISLV